MKIRFFIPILLFFALMLAGCGSSGSPTEDTELVGIALCANEDWPEYPVAQKLEERLNEDGSFRVDLENAGEDAELQNGQVRIMVANHARAIVITYVEGEDESDMITMVRAANIPLIEIDREACKTNPDAEVIRLYNEIMSSHP